MVDVGTPHVTDNGVIVEIEACGVCGTDVSAYKTGRPYNPAVCGHEWVGRIVEAGADVRDRQVGERVSVAVPQRCGRCRPCQLGPGHRCVAAFSVATGRDDHAPAHGGFATHLGVHEERVMPIPETMAVEVAAQIEPAAICHHGVARTSAATGGTVLVQGAGPIGLSTVQWLAQIELENLVVVEPNPARRSLAERLGATVAVTPQDARGAIGDLTNGYGVDVVYECVGLPFAIQEAVERTRPRGSVCLLGVPNGAAEISPRLWLANEITVGGAIAYDRADFDATIAAFASGAIDPTPLHSATVGLDALDGVLASLASGESSDIKVLVDPRI